MPRFFSDFMLVCLLLILVISGLLITHMLKRRESMVTLKIGNTQLTVEPARTEAQIERGLGYRDKVSGDGMLFYLPQPAVATFWMKGMRFPLDFIWINVNTVTDITENVPPPVSANIPDDKMPLYRPNGIVTQVLEVPAGFVKAHNIQKGDSVTLLSH
ncbi:MAG TPA: DUF192 domain-containing protein [Candidatus Saccharimonadia bacterium]|nr:DUF192 domain-containing protein [Candidatus Saccharimonadia bacterium]